MTINLSSYKVIESGLFVRIAVNGYRTGPGGAGTSTVLRFSDYVRSVEVNSELYTGIGRLMNISPTNSDLRTASAGVTIALSGIPNSSLQEIIYSDMKGSKVEVRRVIFDPVTGQPLNIAGNPIGRFFGIVNNYSIEEDIDVAANTASSTIVLECASAIETLSNKITGRKTSPYDMKAVNPSDVSFDRVPNLAASNFNFGAPTT